MKEEFMLNGYVFISQPTQFQKYKHLEQKTATFLAEVTRV
jgi:hypothetical protein